MDEKTNTSSLIVRKLTAENLPQGCTGFGARHLTAPLDWKELTSFPSFQLDIDLSALEHRIVLPSAVQVADKIAFRCALHRFLIRFSAFSG